MIRKSWSMRKIERSTPTMRRTQLQWMQKMWLKLQHSDVSCGIYICSTLFVFHKMELTENEEIDYQIIVWTGLNRNYGMG